MIDWLIAYLALGLILNLTMFIGHQLVRCVEPRRLTSACAATPPGSPLRSPSAFRRTLEIAGAAALLSALWPLLAYWLIRERWPALGDEAPIDQPFAVARRHLLWKTSIEEIERTALVFDPMGAAPKLPFGHLNREWVEFRDGVEAADEVWAFSVRTTGSFGIVETREGFASVGADGPARHFLKGVDWQFQANRSTEGNQI